MNSREMDAIMDKGFNGVQIYMPWSREKDPKVRGFCGCLNDNRGGSRSELHPGKIFTSMDDLYDALVALACKLQEDDARHIYLNSAMQRTMSYHRYELTPEGWPLKPRNMILKGEVAEVPTLEKLSDDQVGRLLAAMQERMKK